MWAGDQKQSKTCSGLRKSMQHSWETIELIILLYQLTSAVPTILCQGESFIATAAIGAHSVLADLLTVIHSLAFINI